MKKYILTLAAFFFLSMILFGQNPTNSFLEKFRIRPSGLTEEPYFSIDGLSELDQVRKFQLDSIIHGYYDYVNEKFIEKSGKDQFTYDENGFPETTVILGFRDGEYKPSLRYLFDFNQDGNMLEFLLQDWNSNSLKWEDYNKRTYSYNEEGSLIEMLYYEVDYGPELELMDRIIFTYDSSGNLLSRLLQATQSGSWYDQTESRYTYDENSNKTSYSYWVSDFGESGKELIRTEYGYDSTGRLTYEIEYENNGYEGGLRPYQKDSFVYDENNRLKTEISSHNEEGDWNAELKKEYSYNSSDIPYLIHWLVAEDGVNWILITQE